MQHTPQLAPQQLSYPSAMDETPKSSRSAYGSLPEMPMSLVLDNSPVSWQSSLTPTMKCMSLSRGRGRPQKQLIEPSYEGYPVDGIEVEKKWWLKMKATEQWYNILSSNQAAEYCGCEKH